MGDIQLYESQVPEELMGAQGTNRSSGRNEINAQNDHDAIASWLKRRARGSAETGRAYHREARRLIMWAIAYKRKPISSLTSDDLEEYRDFLANPPEEMIGWRAPWGNADWRPFASKMETGSVNRCMLIVSSLFGYLKRIRYIEFNPFDIVELDKTDLFSPGKVQRYLDEIQMRAVVEFMRSRTDAKTRRTRFVIALMYFMGLRIGEVCCNGMASFYEKPNGWWMQVVGKGKKTRKVPVPPSMLAELAQYRRFCGLPDLPKSDEEGPLLRALKGSSDGVRERGIRGDVKEVFSAAAQNVDPERAKLLRLASPHWLRHTNLTLQARQTDNNLAALQAVKLNAGHSDIRTTMGYVETQDDERYKSMKNWRW